MQRPLTLVTGASRGIGAAIARELSRAGAAVVLAARRRDACQALADELEAGGGVARAVALDVTDPHSIAEARRAVEALEPELGPLERLVNNAGIAVSLPLLAPPRETDELVARLMAVNFDGARRVSETFLVGMKARRSGAVVNVASSAALRGYAYVSAYCASKFALVGWTLAAADELAKSGIRVNAICPHYVDTPMLSRSIQTLVDKTGRTPEEARAFFSDQNPGRRLVTSEEVARGVQTLLEGPGTGVVLELDGSDRPLSHRPNDRRCAWTS